MSAALGGLSHLAFALPPFPCKPKGMEGVSHPPVSVLCLSQQLPRDLDAPPGLSDEASASGYQILRGELRHSLVDRMGRAGEVT